MSNELKTVGEHQEVKYVLTLKYEEYSTKYTEIPLHHLPSEELIKQLLILSGDHYARVNKITDECKEYSYGEPDSIFVATKTEKTIRDKFFIPIDNSAFTADPKSVATAISTLIYKDTEKMEDKF